MKLTTKLLRKFARAGQSDSCATAPVRTPSEREYYEDLFVKNPLWNKKAPNVDESARWEQIRRLIDRHFTPSPACRILDVGCGRGWLTNLLSAYGNSMGIEPIEPVVEHARRMFPAIRFDVATPATFAGQEVFDLIVSSEVLEHVTDKPGFIGDLRRLLKVRGLLVLSTPRGELYDQWSRKFGKPSQPVEEWITTGDLTTLLELAGFEVLASVTAYELEIYQIHICRRSS